MPELVAILHSFVGLAAVLVGFNSYLYHDASLAPVLVNIHLTEVFLGIFIGAVTFTGSIVAFGKLRGKISSKPLMLPNRHKMNLAALVVSFLLLLVFVRTESVGLQVLALLLMTIIALAFGWHLVASIGGGGHAGGCFNAELLFRLGCRGGWLHVEQRFADCDRRAGRFVRRDPVLHYV